MLSWGVRFQRDDNGYDSTDWYESEVAALAIFRERAADKQRRVDPALHLSLIHIVERA